MDKVGGILYKSDANQTLCEGRIVRIVVHCVSDWLLGFAWRTSIVHSFLKMTCTLIGVTLKRHHLQTAASSQVGVKHFTQANHCGS